MKVIKYNLCTKVNYGTEEQPVIEEVLTPVVMGWSETNETTAKAEAYNGEYTVEDDGEPEPGPTNEERIAELEKNLKQIFTVLAKLGGMEAVS